MKIDLGGQAALLLGNGGPLAEAIGAALSANGASVLVGDPNGGAGSGSVREAARSGRLDVLVFVSSSLSEHLSDASVGGGSPAGIGAPAGLLDSLLTKASDALIRAGGRIVAVGSALGLLPARRDPYRGLGDAALFHLVRTRAMLFGPTGVRINALALGAIVDNGGSEAPLIAGDLGLLPHAPLGRAGRLREVGDAILFLVDPENTAMTGHVLPVDGGWMAGFARDF